MRLEEVLQLEGVKILDAGVFIPENNIGFISRCGNIFRAAEELKKRVKGELKTYELLSSSNFFTIQEVTQEIENGICKLDLEISRLSSSSNKGKRNKNQIISLIRDIRNYIDVIHKLSVRKIVELGYEKQEEYEELSRKIIAVSQLYRLKGPTAPRNIDLYTDEKLIALALALVDKNKVSVVTSDNHLVWIRDYMGDNGFSVMDSKHKQRAREIGVYCRANGEYILRE